MQISVGPSRLALCALCLLSLTHLWGCAGGREAPRPKIELVDVRVAGFDKDGVDLTVTLSVANLASIDVPLEDLQADVLIENTVVAQAVPSQAKFTLMASQAVKVPLKTRLIFKGLSASLSQAPMSLIKGGVKVTVRGSATTAYGLIPIRFEKEMRIEPLVR
ncbi:MAG: hypothetical protein EBT03_06670 [Betaproteobacteria bacterium]|nr:hypothetical protein [Betaproteobacteria bacterium]NBT75346.1 hypothetical protein [Betaproteobacteria bacterium]NBY13459.1 hypothetical protein [Betaproteobacteria bacterium]NCA16699.1 hypothetical protein [Betaproteobacteria bacterium]